MASELRGGATVGGYKIWHEGNFDPNATYDVFSSSPDANGTFTVVDYKRQDGTLYFKSTLSAMGASGYTVCTIQWYDAAGTSVIRTDIWDIGYDASGNVTSKNKR